MNRHFCKTSTCIKGIQVVSSIDIMKSEIARQLKSFVKNGNNMLNIIASQINAHKYRPVAVSTDI
jgi:hypothetical protein